MSVRVRTALIGAVWALASLAFAAVVGLQLSDELSLGREGARASAQVTDTRISEPTGRGSRQPSYQVRYRFSVGGGEYSASDATGRRDIWRSVPEADYEAAAESGALEIAYLPRDPWVNRPVRSESADWTLLAVLAAVGLASALAGASVARGALRRR